MTTQDKFYVIGVLKHIRMVANPWNAQSIDFAMDMLHRSIEEEANSKNVVSIPPGYAPSGGQVYKG